MVVVSVCGNLLAAMIDEAKARNGVNSRGGKRILRTISYSFMQDYCLGAFRHAMMLS